MKIDFAKGSGLIPAIIQHSETNQVLMLGYMNEEALNITNKTGLVTFFSRSRDKIWTKGETSGNFLQLVTKIIDCDNDTLLIKVLPKGPVCHKGTVSCFDEDKFTNMSFLSTLEEIIKSRKSKDESESYTAKLLNGPLRRIAQKVGEEGVETALASVTETDGKLISESADLLYHLLVLLQAKNLGLSDVVNELNKRHK
ncbi:MAG: bifunctional phosphoribosyl-AMP cyclohydrolase/phosphoribosyl-ATP diphosphatase HisIE [Hellea sp.]|nr:bifunctional phosphoribosyl-AMP cyclohydrolase/phosphoribosyl-ATP diphosphatase HisIE [Hellea sp.]